jgi:uncharacterized protein (TIGR03382 family)
MTNADEAICLTDPLNPDTDGDGASDGEEVAAGSDPLDPSSTPIPEPASSWLAVSALLTLALLQRRRRRTSKHTGLIAGSLAIVLVLGCAGIPRYVRGDIRSQGFAAIPAGASFALLPSLVPSSVDAVIAPELVQSLEGSGHPHVTPEQADVLVGYRQSAGGAHSESNGFEAVWRTLRALECPERFSQRIGVVATRSEQGAPAAALWLGELCSDGGGREPSFHAGAFTRELIKSFGANRVRRRVEFLVRTAGVAPTPSASKAPSQAPEPSASTPTASPSATAPEFVPAAGFAEPGPTWADAKAACARLALRPDVGCSVIVVIASGKPVLELGYPTRAAALESWRHDVAEAGVVFCATATRHGLMELATVHLSAPDHSVSRSCRSLEP